MPQSFNAASGLTPLAKKLASRIAKTGPIPVHDYMQACLYDPEFGYYRTKNPLGRGGDFTTAPEISQVFGELAGLWGGEVWRQMGEPVALRLIELGPGRGTLMTDALRALRVLPDFLKNVTVHLIDTSEPLRRAQERALTGCGCPVSWHESLEDVPPGPSVVIANEFFDCLPVRQYLFDASAQAWSERMVTFADGAFHFVPAARLDGVPSHPVLLPKGRRDAVSPSPLGERAGVRGAFLPDISDPPRPGDADHGAILEVRPGASAMIREFAARAASAPFAALVADYGYTQPSLGDTIQAVRNHRFAGIFDDPGDADLTAHVDFSNLKGEALWLGLEAFGPIPMGEWLLRLGLEARVRQLAGGLSGGEAKDLMAGISRLVDPTQMGALFKVLALAGGVRAPPPPFS